MRHVKFLGAAVLVQKPSQFQDLFGRVGAPAGGRNDGGEAVEPWNKIDHLDASLFGPPTQLAARQLTGINIVPAESGASCH